MSIIAKNTSGNSIEILPAGSYAARCYSMVHIGTNTETILGQTKDLNKVRITWELPTELAVFNEDKGEQPRVISKEFTLSMHEKSTLRKFLESWRGKTFTQAESEAFDITKLLGVPCLLSITHKEAKNGNTYAEISAVSMLPKGMECPDQINPSLELSYNKWNEDVFNSLPDFIKNKIVTSREYKEMIEPHSTEDAGEEEVPF